MSQNIYSQWQTQTYRHVTDYVYYDRRTDSHHLYIQRKAYIHYAQTRHKLCIQWQTHRLYIPWQTKTHWHATNYIYNDRQTDSYRIYIQWQTKTHRFATDYVCSGRRRHADMSQNAYSMTDTQTVTDYIFSERHRLCIFNDRHTVNHRLYSQWHICMSVSVTDYIVCDWLCVCHWKCKVCVFRWIYSLWLSVIESAFCDISWKAHRQSPTIYTVTETYTRHKLYIHWQTHRQSHTVHSVSDTDRHRPYFYFSVTDTDRHRL